MFLKAKCNPTMCNMVSNKTCGEYISKSPSPRKCPVHRWSHLHVFSNRILWTQIPSWVYQGYSATLRKKLTNRPLLWRCICINNRIWLSVLGGYSFPFSFLTSERTSDKENPSSSSWRSSKWISISLRFCPGYLPHLILRFRSSFQPSSIYRPTSYKTLLSN